MIEVPDKSPAISVIVTTYNKERELELVLEGLRHQNFRDFEIIVADDGSGEATKAVIEDARERTDIPIVHSWQEDKGFRAARSRNLAIAKARAPIVAMIDGDCIPLPDFLEDQLATLKPSTYLAGERYFLSEEEAATLDPKDIRQGSKDFLEALVPEREVKRVGSIRFKNRFYRAFRIKVRPKVMTCNFIATKADLERINGLDERYVGWGHEDTDLGRRLRHIGVKSANELAPGRIIHIWHKTVSSFAGRVRDCANAEYYDRGFFLACCRKGLRERSYEDLRIALGKLSPELQEAAKSLGAQSDSKDPELWIEFQSAQNRAKKLPKVDVPILVIAGDAPKPSKGAINSAGLILAQEPWKQEDFSGHGGVFANFAGKKLDEEGFEALRAAIDEVV